MLLAQKLAFAVIIKPLQFQASSGKPVSITTTTTVTDGAPPSAPKDDDALNTSIEEKLKRMEADRGGYDLNVAAFGTDNIEIPNKSAVNIG